MYPAYKISVSPGDKVWEAGDFGGRSRRGARAVSPPQLEFKVITSGAACLAAPPCRARTSGGREEVCGWEAPQLSPSFPFSPQLTMRGKLARKSGSTRNLAGSSRSPRNFPCGGGWRSGCLARDRLATAPSVGGSGDGHICLCTWCA
jgi:hypothetical protein